MISNRLEQTLKKKGLTISAAAKVCDISRPQFNAYVIGKRLPTTELLKRICERLEVSADYLLGLTDKEDENELKRVVHKLDEKERGLLVEIAKAVYRNRKE